MISSPQCHSMWKNKKGKNLISNNFFLIWDPHKSKIFIPKAIKQKCERKPFFSCERTIAKIMPFQCSCYSCPHTAIPMLPFPYYCFHTTATITMLPVPSYHSTTTISTLLRHATHYMLLSPCYCTHPSLLSPCYLLRILFKINYIPRTNKSAK